MKWTAQDNTLLDQLVKQGAEISIMCERLGKTKPAIDSKLRRLGIRIAMSSKIPNGEKPKKVAKPRKSKKVVQSEPVVEAPAVVVEAVVSVPAIIEKKITKPRSRPVKPPAPITEEDLTVVRIYPIEKIGPRGCHWPIGDVNDPEFRFCGEDRKGIGPYCPNHMKIAFHNTSPVRVVEPA